MNNTINFIERKTEISKDQIEEIEELQKTLKTVDVDAVYRALTHSPEEEGNVNNSLRNKTDRAEFERYFGGIAKANDLVKKSKKFEK